MIRINTLNCCGETLTIELMGYINKTEFDILYDFLQSQVEEEVREVCIVANEVRSLNPLLEQDAVRLGQFSRGQPHLRSTEKSCKYTEKSCKYTEKSWKALRRWRGRAS